MGDVPEPRDPVDLRVTASALSALAGGVLKAVRRDIRITAAGGVLGALALGGFHWLWRGDWGGGVNPLSWSEAPRAGFFESLWIGGLIGSGVALCLARWRRSHGVPP